MALRGEGTYPRSHSKLVLDPRLTGRLCDCPAIRTPAGLSGGGWCRCSMWPAQRAPRHVSGILAVGRLSLFKHTHFLSPGAGSCLGGWGEGVPAMALETLSN